MLENIIQNLDKIPHGVYTKVIDNKEIILNVSDFGLSKLITVKVDKEIIYTFCLYNNKNKTINIHFPEDKYSLTLSFFDTYLQDIYILTKKFDDEYKVRSNQISNMTNGRDYFLENNLLCDIKEDCKNYCYTSAVVYDIEDKNIKVFVENANGYYIVNYVDFINKIKSNIKNKVNNGTDYEGLINNKELKSLVNLLDKFDAKNIKKISSVFEMYKDKLNNYDSIIKLVDLDNFVQELVDFPDKAERNNFKNMIDAINLNDIDVLKELRFAISKRIKRLSKKQK